jgi:error-prone DNA polymerase
VGFTNHPGTAWSDLRRQMTGDPAPDTIDRGPVGRRRDGYAAPSDLTGHPVTGEEPPAARVAYAELHCHSNFSFLDGASHPEELAEEAARLGIDTVALTDHDGFYGAVRFAEAAKEVGVRTAFGAELSLDLPSRQTGVPDPVGTHLLVLARGLPGYRRLARVISSGHLRGEEKGRPVYDMTEVVDELAGEVLVLSGCRKGAVRQALDLDGPDAAGQELAWLVDRFGRSHVAVELTDHGLPEDSTRNDQLAALAAAWGVPVVATNAVHYAHPARGRLAAALAAVRARRSLAEMDGWLPPAPAAHLRSGVEMMQWFARYPGAVQAAAVLGSECAFDLDLVAPKLPPFPVPDGHTEASYLRELTWAGAADRYGPRPQVEKAYQQLDHELEIIEELGFPGYFLIVWDIVRFCAERRIYCQGRGSAANSAVCYALGVTNVDSVRWELLFERFLAPDRDGPPDIDLDIESDRREEVIQYVYQRHGRRRAAQVANVITYRARSAVRDMAGALGYGQGMQDRWAKTLGHWGSVADGAADEADPLPRDVAALAAQVEGFPRHLGIHSGGMVLCDRPVSEVCPVEWATAPGRTVLQWDKDDCAAAGLVKFDLLGLGMLSAVHYAVDLVAKHHGVPVELAHLDLADPAIYNMLCAADTVGVFQVESRAQMGTLPRLRPRTFWDLAVQIALIRPGPIQGGSVHPYLARRAGQPWSHPHPLMRAALQRTLGVPLFQEQVMQMAMDVADFSAAEADQLRRAMGAKRSTAKMDRLRDRLYDGMAHNGITGHLADMIFTQIKAFSGYGFPQSHALSFAYLVFASAHLKLYYPAAFCAALLRAQPMGFYSPQSLVADARRHGVQVKGVDIQASTVHANLEPDQESTGGQAVRIGLSGVRLITEEIAERIVADRTAHGPYRDQVDLVGRCGLSEDQLAALATAGAFDAFGEDRRQALWTAGAAARENRNTLPGTELVLPAPPLPGMSAWELLSADVWATGMSPDSHPVELLRAHLNEQGALALGQLARIPDGTRVLVGGAITHRQRPPTAGGVTFVNIEDETAMLNTVVSAGCWDRYKITWRDALGVLVRGVLRNSQGAISLDADQVSPLDVRASARSRDFR